MVMRRTEKSSCLGDGPIQLSVGIEDSRDLLDDLYTTLEAVDSNPEDRHG